MISFTKPSNLNGIELRNELRAAGVTISDDINAVQLDADMVLWLDINEADQVQAASVVAAHNGSDTDAEPTIEDKLASVGLNIADLKAALGL